VPYAKTTHSRRTIPFGVELADALREHRRAQAGERVSRRTGIAETMRGADGDALAAAQASAWEDNGLVVCGQYGQLLRASKVSQRLTPVVQLLERQGVLATEGATFHSLRHAHASLLLRNKVPVHVVSRRLGHSRIQITLDYYAHAMPGDDEEVAEVLDLLISRAYGEDTNDISTTFETQNEAAGATS
jgi:integrase